MKDEVRGDPQSTMPKAILKSGSFSKILMATEGNFGMLYNGVSNVSVAYLEVGEPEITF